MKEQWPKSYLNKWEPFMSDKRSEKYAFTLLDHVFLNNFTTKNISLVDICSGTGHFGRSIKKHIENNKINVNLTFVDASEKILSSIKLEKGEKILTGDATSLSHIKSESQDVVVCRYGFNNLPKEEWAPALDEALRILKPGGVFLLQDHFIPGPTFSALVNEAEQFLAKIEGKKKVPFIYSTEQFNNVLDTHPKVLKQVKVGYGFFINIWDRLSAKSDILPNFEKAKTEILQFYKETCLNKYKLLIVDPEEYIHVYNVTYGIIKK